MQRGFVCHVQIVRGLLVFSLRIDPFSLYLPFKPRVLLSYHIHLLDAPFSEFSKFLLHFGLTFQDNGYICLGRPPPFLVLTIRLLVETIQ